MIKRLRLTLSYLRDKEIPVVKKLLFMASLLYFIFPADIVPDFILGLGLLDDVTVLAFIWAAYKAELDAYEEKKRAGKTGEARIIRIDSKRKED